TPSLPGSLPLFRGPNLVTWPGDPVPPSAAFDSPGVSIVYAFDAATGKWKRYAPDLPGYFNNLSTLQRGQAYWVIADMPATLALTR
ncbi:MAG: hypothetical protein ACM3S1_11225, partial [Hyphomicrobiales bacterium]